MFLRALELAGKIFLLCLLTSMMQVTFEPHWNWKSHWNLWNPGFISFDTYWILGRIPTWWCLKQNVNLFFSLNIYAIFETTVLQVKPIGNSSAVPRLLDLKEGTPENIQIIKKVENFSSSISIVSYLSLTEKALTCGLWKMMMSLTKIQHIDIFYPVLAGGSDQFGIY